MSFYELALGLVKIPMLGGESSDFQEAAKRPEMLIVSDIAESTGKNYAPHWKKFVMFCERNNRLYLPASLDTIVVYLLVCLSLFMARAAIHYFHNKFSSSSSPTDDWKKSQVMLALKRSLGKPVVKRALFSNIL